MTWWHNPELWRERYTYSDISRPTEDTALQNVYTSALVAIGHYRTELDEIERDVDSTYNSIKRNQTYPKSEQQLVTETAMRLKMFPSHVRAVLKDIAFVKHNYQRSQEYNLLGVPCVINKIIPNVA